MKLTSIVTTFLAVSAPLFASAESGGLKGGAATTTTKAQQGNRKLEPGEWTARQTAAQAAGQRQFEFPTIDELNEIYGTFCEICGVADTVTQLLGADAQFCTSLCDLIDEIPNPDDVTCFSELSTVQVEHIGSVAMKDLQIGARVLTQPGTYETVYAFGHKNPTKTAEFLQFQTEQANLEMTGGHLVFVDGKMNPVRADSIKVGDSLSGGKMITKISTIQRDGVYSPLTPSGKIVVDGIVASTYISLQKESNEFVEFQGGYSSYLSFQDFIHMTLSPFRMLCMGISSTLGNTYTDDGIPMYASYGMDFAKWADQQNIVVQFVLFLAVGALAGASMFVENTFGATLGPTGLVAGAGIYAMMKKKGISFTTTGSKIKSV